MIKDIKYNGYTAQPSDYECPDGDLASSINLLNEDGYIKNIPQPRNELTIATGHTLLLIHAVPGQENYIILSGDRKSRFTLAWLKRNPFDESGPLPSTADAQTIDAPKPFSQLLDIAIVGNTLAVATAAGLFYILWKDDSYKYLGDRPQFIPISFGAYKAGTLTDYTIPRYSGAPETTVHHINDGNIESIPHYSEDDAYWTPFSNAAMGLLLSEVAEKVTSQGYLYQPFYIRYAYKLYDGTYSWHSAPILMLVSTQVPIIYYLVNDYNPGDQSLALKIQLDVPYFGIAYRIFGSVKELKEWSDIIAGIDVFISSPIYTYNQAKTPSVPTSLRELYAGGHLSAKLFSGHYGDANSSNPDCNYVDHYIDSSDLYNGAVCELSKADKFEEKLQNEYLFYKVASLSLEDIDSMPAMKRLPLLKSDLSNINTLESLPDEYNSHATILPGTLQTYNNRLMLGDISISPPGPLPICSLVQSATKTEETPIPVDAAERVKVFTRVNGKKCVSEYIHTISSTSDPLPVNPAPDPGQYPFDEAFPRFLYHPDPSAYKMEITTPDGKFYSLPLKQHPHLSGSYWFGGIESTPADVGEEKDNSVTASSAIVANKIYISEINNPFIFPVTNIITIPCGRVSALCSAAKALSQGQFGQFPLYAFTDDGIWALELTATGTISARQPITRDVCTNPHGILQIDNAVLFPSDRGIMMISGSQTQCITDSVNTSSPFNLLQLPAMEKLHSMLGHSADNCLPVLPFDAFLKDCAMLYDYPHQRIILFNQSISYAYVFSLKSHRWGMMHSRLNYPVNSYPEALAVTHDGYLANFAFSDGNPVRGLLVSRPVKLETPDVLKTVDTVIQRGHFRNGSVQSVLYGSRDLFSWHLIWSSKDHFLRGFRGTPYKYFRIACVTALAEGENIFGASLQFTPRHTNQPR